MPRIGTILTLTTAALLLAAAVVQAATTVTLKAEAVAGGDAVELAEVAALTGSDEVVTARLGQVFLARCPAPGASISLSGSYVLNRLKASGIDVGKVDIGGAERVIISGKGVEVSAAKIERMAEAFIRSRMKREGDQVTVRSRGVQGRLMVPAGHLEYEFQVRKEEDFLGPVVVRIDIRVDGKIAARPNVTFDVDVSMPVVVAARQIRRSQVLTPEDVEVTMVDTSRPARGQVRRVSDVVGRRAKTYIDVGRPISFTMIEVRPAVKRGDIVTLEARSGCLLATARGRAEENGVPGDTIVVLNITSRRKVFGVVVGDRRVAVEF